MSYNKETGMWDGYIYMIQNDIHPEKYYIGITTQSLLQRWRGHIFQARHHKNTDALHNAMTKYGIEHFGMDIIATYSKSTKSELIHFLKEMETYYIAIFNSYYNGYNSTLGGDLLNHTKRSVCQYDLDGNYICEYNSIESVKEVLKLESVSSIYDCCLHIKNCYSAYGYMWKYKDDNCNLPILSVGEKTNIITRSKVRNSKIHKYDYKGMLVKTYNCLDDVLDDNPNINRRQLLKSLCGKAVYADMHIYRFDGDKLTKYKTYNEKPKVVEKLDLDNNVIQVYKNCEDAAIDNNLERAQISNVCLGRCQLSGGYKWRYPENYYAALIA